MVFSSSIFMFTFLPLSLILYYIIPKNNTKLRNKLLFFVSLFFYAWGEPIYLLIMIISIVINYIFALLVEKYRKNIKFQKIIIAIMLMANLSILFVFKYTGFFIKNINTLLHSNFYVPNIALPIGISFFTFQAISYVIDVYRRVDIDGEIVEAQKSIINVGLYIAFFPQLIAGPIVRYKTIALQINKRTESLEKFEQGIKRFIIGLSKKILLANNLALIADKTFSMTNSQLCSSLAWLGAVAYTLQILFDFSGYSDMAIGLGKMFGFEFMENFNYPYISKSVSEFWRRWHISLGNWFKDYVYIPLGGNRHGIKRTIFNSFVVWLLTGIWHGASWNFIVWGMYYFVFITIENLFKTKNSISKGNILKNTIKHLYLIIVVVIGWVFFKANTLQSAIAYLQSMFSMNSNLEANKITSWYIYQNKYFLMLAILFSTPIVPYIKNVCEKSVRTIYSTKIINLVFKFTYSFLYIILLLINISYIIKNTYSPFIYFNF